MGSPGSLPVMMCRKCAWNTNATGVTTVSELMQRDADPYPLASQTFRDITACHNASGGSAKNGGQARVGLIPSLSSSTVASDDADQGPAVPSSIADFTAFFDAKEKGWCGFEGVSDEERAQMDAFGSIPPDFYKTVDLDELMPRRERVMADVWRKADGVARRRVPSPRVLVKSPYSGEVVDVVLDDRKPLRGKWNASRFMPQLTAHVRHDCARCKAENSGEGLVTIDLNVTNVVDTGLSLRVTVDSATTAAALETAEMQIPARGTRKVSLIARPQPAPRTRDTGAVWCTSTATLEVSVKFDGVAQQSESNDAPHSPGRKWACRAFIRHYRVW